jgi:arylsulfatase A-like enzyme
MARIELLPRRRVTLAIGVLLIGAVVTLSFMFRHSTPKDALAAHGWTRRLARPNLLILIGDDHAADTLGIDGDVHKATPRIDALARQGVYFKRAYCNSPLCTPSRQSLITGRLPHAVGVTRLSTPLPASAVTLGDWLGDVGYKTAAYGKMHFNSRRRHGFDNRIDTPDWEAYLKKHPPRGGNRSRPWRPLRDPAPEWLNAANRPFGLPDESMEASYFVKQAAAFLRREDQPSVLVVGFNEPHSPFKYPDDWARRFKPEEFAVAPLTESDRRELPTVFESITPEENRGIQAAYYTSISYVDAKVGAVLDSLEASGQADNTIVVYLSDNGYLRGNHGRFEKHCFYESAIRVPLIIRWPKHLPEGRVIDGPVELIDLVPTLCELLGCDRPPGTQGRSLVELTKGKPGAKGREFVFSEYLENEEAMISDGRFKLIVGTGNRRRNDGYATANPTPGPYEHLYDLASDPNEDADLVARPDLAAIHNRLLDALYERLTTTRTADDPPPRGLSRIETIHRCLRPRD